MSAVEQLKQKFMDLEKREQYVVFALGLVIIFFLWDQLLYSPLERDSKKIKQQMSALESNRSQVAADTAKLMQDASTSPNAVLQRDKERLNKTLQAMNDKISGLTAELIPPREMATVLEKVLHQKTRLKLIKVTNLPAVELTADALADHSNLEEGSLLYRHGVELQLEGDFFETLRYLRALEALPWQILWGNLTYEVETFPRASIILRLNTLSTNAGWIGV